MFDAKGIPAPVNITWDEYLDLAKQNTYIEGGNKYWGGLIPLWTMNIGASSAGEHLTDEPLPLTRKYAEVLYRAYNTPVCFILRDSKVICAAVILTARNK